MGKRVIEMLNTIAQAIYDKKGFNITAINVQKSSSLTNYFIIAEGSVERHVLALSATIKEIVRESGAQVLHMDGDKSGDWVVMDCGEIYIHLFIPKMREMYALEEVLEGDIVDLKIESKEP